MESQESTINLADLAPIKLRGRYFSVDELDIIQRCVSENFDLGRTFISKVICEELNWKQPNGWLKDRACRDVLRQLASMNVLELPPPLTKPKISDRKQKSSQDYLLSEYDCTTPINSFPQSIELEFAKGNLSEKVWNALVSQFHYLGHDVLVGRSIKYLIKTDGRLLGAIAFSSPAWRVDPRDKVLNSIGITDVREHTINNSRFLILPYVQVPNLASHILALATKQIVTDWNSYYSVKPLVAETFVQPSLYFGTCYKAANWVEVGTTKGYAKKGQIYHNSQEPKRIFLYGLDKQTRRQLQQVYREVFHGGT